MYTRRLVVVLLMAQNTARHKITTKSHISEYKARVAHISNLSF